MKTEFYKSDKVDELLKISEELIERANIVRYLFPIWARLLNQKAAEIRVEANALDNNSESPSQMFFGTDGKPW